MCTHDDAHKTNYFRPPNKKKKTKNINHFKNIDKFNGEAYRKIKVSFTIYSPFT